MPVSHDPEHDYLPWLMTDLGLLCVAVVCVILLAGFFV